MPRLRPLLFLLVLASLVSLPSFAAHPAHSKLQPCKAWRDGEVDALCGEYQVWENRQAKAGRKITLKVLVLPALGPNPKPDPIVGLGGGPGQAASELTGILGPEARQDRDLLFVDQRGTGEPDRLQCLLGTPGDFQSLFDYLFPLDAVRRCREELSKKYDLTLYTTAAGADDLDEVRAWLGYDKLNLAGYSYGTRMALVYLGRHPESVRTVTLWGSVPMDETLPISHSAAGQRSLGIVFEMCERDAACRARFPVRKDFQAVMARLDEGPVEVEVPHPETEKPTKVRLPGEVVREAIRSILYDAQGVAVLPLAFHEAAAGDWKRLGGTVVQRRYGLLNGLSHGLFFSVTCSEDRPHITEKEIAARTAGSVLRDDRVRRQNAACDLWPRAKVEPGHREAVRSDLPVLVIHGRLDPVTPPEFGRRTVASLPNSLFLEIPYESHAISADCPVGIAQTFIDRGSVQGLDTSCIAEMKPAPFVLEPPQPAPAPKLTLKPCTTIPGLPPEARCGTYEVWENRAAKSGRKIPLRVVVIPAEGPDRLSDPFVLFNGGPGDSAVDAAAWIAQEFKALRKRRDMLFVDFRGTGGSAGLFCNELEGNEGLQGFLDHYMPSDRVRACAERLSKTADLAQYTNDNSIDDVDEVRAALGYDKLNLYGGSAGSRAALVYMRRHPETVRTAVLGGVVPVDEHWPLAVARNAQRALDGLIAECEGDAACRGAFPRLRDEVAAVLQQAEKEPAVITLTDAETGKPLELRLTRNGVAQSLRYMLYHPSSASMLPLVVQRAAQGDWRLMAETARSLGIPMNSYSRGFDLSLTCSEDVAFVREEEIPAAVQGTFLGDLRIRALQAACAAWPVSPVGREFRIPVTSDVPALLLSGERDPVTPPANAEQTARTLKTRLHVVTPDGGHGYGGIEGASECVNGLIVQFVETGTLKGLDTSCMARTKRPEFVLKQDPDVALPADQLARLAGTYKDPENGYEIRIETVGQHLRILEGEYPPTVLVATSPTRFRVEGMPPSYVCEFQVTAGRATAVVLERPGAPSQTLAREGS